MKKLLALVLSLALLTVGACAMAEGTLSICSPNSDGLLSIIPLFEERTGIKVQVESLGTGDCMKRIASEASQEFCTFDLMYGGSLANYEANKDLFQDYVSAEDANLMEAYKNTRGYCTNYTIDGSVLLVNTDMLAELGVEVTGYADLLKPELVGKLRHSFAVRIVSKTHIVATELFCYTDVFDTLLVGKSFSALNAVLVTAYSSQKYALAV